MECLARLGYIFAGQRAFGEGDTYIAGALGAILGWKYVLWVLLAGFIIQFAVSLPLYLANLFKTGRGRVGLELILFLILSGLIYYYASVLQNLIYGCAVALMAIMAMHIARVILADIKTPSKLTYLPYVPALVVAATVAVWMVY